MLEVRPSHWIASGLDSQRLGETGQTRGSRSQEESRDKSDPMECVAYCREGTPRVGKALIQTQASEARMNVIRTKTEALLDYNLCTCG